LKLFIYTFDKVKEDKFSNLNNPKLLAKFYYFQSSRQTLNVKKFQSDDLSCITESDNESNMSLFSHEYTNEQSHQTIDKVDKDDKPLKILSEIKDILEFLSLGDYLKIFCKVNFLLINLNIS